LDWWNVLSNPSSLSPFAQILSAKRTTNATMISPGAWRQLAGAYTAGTLSYVLAVLFLEEKNSLLVEADKW
jgi:hypothetical protein